MTTPRAAAAPATLGRAADPAFLAWFGDTTFPDGAPDAPPLSQAAWEATYARLLAAARAPGLLAPLYAFEAPLAGMRPDGPVPVAVIDVPVCSADADRAREAARVASSHDLAVDVAALAEGARPGRAFAAAALLHGQWGHAAPSVRGPTATFALDERFWVALPGAARPDTLSLDPGDGGGPRDVAVPSAGAPSRVGAAYPRDVTEATATLVACYGAERRTARFTVHVNGPPAAPAPDDVWPLAATAPDGAAVSGRACVYRAAGHADVVHPIVMCEGFPGGYAPDYMYDTLNQAGLADALRARGYDLVVLHYDAGAGPIQHNAHLLAACLAEARRRTPNETVVGGVSMGGLVSRYALAWMETHGVEHGARAFLTIDTPHLGAYTVVADQWMAKFLAAASPLAATMAAVLDSPANQQFVARWLRGDRAEASPERGAFLADLRAVGDWPRRPRRLAVASGHGRGTTDDGGTGRRPILTLDGAPFAEARLYTLADGGSGVVAEGRCAAPAAGVPNTLAATSDLAWEDVPGGTNDYTAQAAGIARALGCGTVTCHEPRCCSVPTVSALALDEDPRSPVPPPASGRSPFHDYVCSAENEPHVTITPDVAAWILDRLGPPPTRVPNVTTSVPAAAESYTGPAATAAAAAAAASTNAAPIDPATVNLHDPAFSADPYPTYAALRRAAPVVVLAPYGSHWVFRHADVIAALSDPATFPKQPPGGAPAKPGVFGALDALPPGVFSADMPFHTTVRGALEPPLVAAFAGAPQTAAAIADEIVGAIRAGRTRRLELMSDYATAVPSGTLFTLLGLPRGDFGQLVAMTTAIALANDRTQSVSVQVGGGMAAMAMYAYCQGRVRAAAPSSLLGQMRESAAAAGLGDVEVQASLVNFIVAGYLSTTFLIGTGVLNLLQHPDQLDRLRADPSLAGAAVREMLRRDAPAQVVDRVVATDTTLGGVPLAAGARVTLVLGSANRDERVFHDPDRFVIGRDDGGAAIAFGAGIHHCIGAPLVGIVAPIAIGALVGAFPDLALAGKPQWQTDPYLRAPANVPLAI